jgi:hypothetical protein
MNAITRFTRTTAINDPEDFQMPYRIYGLTELELMQAKYQKLNNLSKGLSIRFNGQA